MIKAVFFDLDRTILDRDTSLRDFILSQHDKFSAELRHVSKERYVSRFLELDDRGKCWKDEVYRTLASEFKITSVNWKTLFDDFDARISGYYVVFPNTREVLRCLVTSGYRLGIITNGRGEFQNRTIDALGIRSYFSKIFISELEGIRKPAAELFLRASTSQGVQVQEFLFVGDSIEADIRGAKRVGMWTAWKRDRGDLTVVNEADLTFEDLTELPALLSNSMLFS